MSKILELPIFKPVICSTCGCKYEFEEGDELQPILLSPARDCNGIIQHKSALTLSCPICGTNNKVEFVDEGD